MKQHEGLYDPQRLIHSSCSNAHTF